MVGRYLLSSCRSACLSVCLSQAGVVSKRLDEWSWFLARRLPSTYTTLSCKEIWVSPKLRYFCLELCPKLWTLKNFATASRSSCQQEAQLSPRDRAMRRVNWNLANCHATVQKLLIRQVLAKSMVWSWRFSRRQCVMDNVQQPWRDRVGSHCLRCHKQTDDGRVVYITCIPTTCCGEIF